MSAYCSDFDVRILCFKILIIPIMYSAGLIASVAAATAAAVADNDDDHDNFKFLH